MSQQVEVVTEETFVVKLGPELDRIIDVVERDTGEEATEKELFDAASEYKPQGQEEALTILVDRASPEEIRSGTFDEMFVQAMQAFWKSEAIDDDDAS